MNQPALSAFLCVSTATIPGRYPLAVIDAELKQTTDRILGMIKDLSA